MKLVIAGSRTITSFSKMQDTMSRLNSLNPALIARFDEVVSGTANGVDKLGERWAERYGLPITRMPADWSKGRGAGHVRNGKMADYGDFAVILWDGQSPGTRGMIREMQKRNKPYFLDIHEVD